MAHNINKRKPHGGKVQGAAAGNAPASSDMQPTPAPTRKIAPDLISAPRQPISGGGYGQSGGAGLNNPSSIPPGTRLTSPMADVLAEGQDDGEGVLDKVIREGTKLDDLVTGQLRSIAKGNVSDHPAMKSPNKTGNGTYDFDSLPATIGSSAAQPVRKP